MESQKRLATLNSRYEKLVELNAENRYTSSERCGQYLSLLLSIKKEKMSIWIENRKDPLTAANLENAKNALIGLTYKQLFNLTSPV